VGSIQKNKTIQKQAYETLGSIAIAAIFSEGFKVITDRERPYQKYTFIHAKDASEQGKSFPSAHTSLAFATATSLTLEYKKWYVAVPAYVWAASVGYSRLYLGEHYPSDVLGGAAIGVGSAFLSHWLTKKYSNKFLPQCF